MTIKNLVDKLDATIINLPEPDRVISSGYCGDFLSFVMGKAENNCMWFTIMNNVNVCAVASLADVGVIVLCEGVKPDKLLAEKAKEKGINLILTELPIFEAVKKL
ncbi:MAG: hypothetical protein WCR54_03165 [Clostridia bacterium]